MGELDPREIERLMATRATLVLRLLKATERLDKTKAISVICSYMALVDLENIVVGEEADLARESRARER